MRTENTKEKREKKAGKRISKKKQKLCHTGKEDLKRRGTSFCTEEKHSPRREKKKKGKKIKANAIKRSKRVWKGKKARE